MMEMRMITELLAKYGDIGSMYLLMVAVPFGLWRYHLKQVRQPDTVEQR